MKSKSDLLGGENRILTKVARLEARVVNLAQECLQQGGQMASQNMEVGLSMNGGPSRPQGRRELT